MGENLGTGKAGRKDLEDRVGKRRWIRRIGGDEFREQRVAAMTGACVGQPASPDAFGTIGRANVLLAGGCGVYEVNACDGRKTSSPLFVSLLVLDQMN